MPNRLIKESICRSDQINALTSFEEVLFYRLIVNADDYGRFDGRLAVIKNILFPLKEGISTDQIGMALTALSKQELVTCYSVGGKPFIRLTGWERHQSIRAKKSKYPDEIPSDGERAQAPATNCKQMQADASECPRNPIQSESNPNPNTNAENARAERKRFTPPTVEEVEAFCQEKGLKVVATTFVNHYDSNGWTIGKSPMRDWRAACRTWSSREQTPATKPAKTVREQQYSQREYADETALPDWMAQQLAQMPKGGGRDG